MTSIGVVSKLDFLISQKNKKKRGFNFEHKIKSGVGSIECVGGRKFRFYSKFVKKEHWEPHSAADIVASDEVEFTPAQIFFPPSENFSGKKYSDLQKKVLGYEMIALDISKPRKGHKYFG